LTQHFAPLFCVHVSRYLWRMTHASRTISRDFASDNTAGAHPAVMAALAHANEGTSPAYGHDPLTHSVEQRFSALFERDVAVALVATGTAANALAIASVTPPWGAVLTHTESHVSDDECGAPEFFADGAKLVGLPGTGNKLSADVLAERLSRMPHGVLRQVQPACLSITQATEAGQVYTQAEVTALAKIAHECSMMVHMDGARFANAVATLGCTPAEITWKAGVDILTFGGTKNGAFAAEAVIFFDKGKAAQLPWRAKRAGQILSKGRFLAAQWDALLENGLWLDLARHANAMASALGSGLAGISGVRLGWQVQANEVFALLPALIWRRLEAAGYPLRDWSVTALPNGIALAPGERLIRLVCSFATTQSDVTALIATARSN
jgi:threonine aldolase